MLFDIISLIIIVISLIIGFKTGAAKVIGRLFSLVISFLCAVFLSHILASFIYTTFIQAAVINNITEIANNSALATASQKANELLSDFPIIFANIMSYFNVTESSVTDLYNSSAMNTIENAVMTPVVAVISLILFLILFGLILFLVRKLINLIVKLFRLPVIRVLDSAVGLFIGLMEGLILIYILAIAVSIAIPFTGGNLYFLNEGYINSSYVFSLIYNGEIVNSLQNFIFSIGK